MQEQTTHQTLAPEEPRTPAPVLPQSDTSEATASNAEAGPEKQAASDAPSSPETLATTPITKVDGIPEWVRKTSGELKSIHFRYLLPPNEASLFEKSRARAEYTRDPWESMPLPTRYAAYGTTKELFARIKLAIAEQTHLSDKDSALLTLWVFSTWFHDVLSIAPGLVITGPAHEGDAVLRALYAFCYHPVLVAGMTGAALSAIQWDKKPTLLIFEPNLSSRLAALLCSSTRRGYLALRTVPGASKSAFDYYGSKAVYAGEDPPIRAMLQHCVHINALPASRVFSQHVAPMTEDMTQHLQNQLLRYRSEHLPEVSKLELCAAGLSPDFNAIASALCECIVNAPDLQNELLSLLTPYSDQQIAERLDDLGTLSVGAALALCHHGKDQILINEIATEVNRVLKDRGERIQYSPERVGHTLKKAGLISRRVSAAGNGFVLDHATQVRIHEVAAAYGCVGLTAIRKTSIVHCANKTNELCRLCRMWRFFAVFERCQRRHPHRANRILPLRRSLHRTRLRAGEPSRDHLAH
jgi:hypothetical protein